jgi:hypothetical protein
LTKVRDFTGGDAEAATNILKLFAGGLHFSHAKAYLKQ